MTEKENNQGAQWSSQTSDLEILQCTEAVGQDTENACENGSFSPFRLVSGLINKVRQDPVVSSCALEVKFAQF